MTAEERLQRTAEADQLAENAYEKAGGTTQGMALIAVGGYGRRELAPYSDLDVVLVHDESTDPGEVASQVWYPLWDSGVNLDHSVRLLPEMLTAAAGDLKVALGLLDIRHLAGDPNLTLRLRTAVLAQWRRDARERLPDLQAMVRKRHELSGELGHRSVPDIKESAGGLRDATILKALTATWLVDVPHADLEASRLALLDVRDLVHASAGRGVDRISPEMWSDLATGLDLPDARSAQVHVRGLGRRIAHLSRLSWRRVDDVLRRPRATAPRRPQLERVAPGVALSGAEIVLDRGADPRKDPLLLLRAAAEAAERDLLLAPPTAGRLARDAAALPDPWPEEARQLLVRLLAAGPSLLPVWETLEETGALGKILPEWERIRLLPHASAIHRFTVDRHVVETCIEASGLIRHVGRPDVLMVAALLHDIGKGGLTEHSVAGEPVAREVAQRMGFSASCVELIAQLVRWHLLLSETATTRDPDDPATVELVARHVETPEALELLTALTEADAKAASPQAWSSWRARLVLDLSGKVRRALEEGRLPESPDTPEVDVPREVLEGGFTITVDTAAAGGCLVEVLAPDRVGLLADLAGLFALNRIPVRSARVWHQDGVGVSRWEVGQETVDVGFLRSKLSAIFEGRMTPADRLRIHDPVKLAPTVQVRGDASTTSTVLEVRAADQPGVVYLVCTTLAAMDIDVRSAHVDTLGPQAVDVFYLQEAHAGVLSEVRAADAAHAVRAALAGGAGTGSGARGR
ncbi:[protein-PII] uridylyltransferase [Nocardioides bruguierae]|uniref:Bifunctional uridylyltransferase/uridylyl-removing enzyme n=1 Tax=Nocardioides bruguierae TaxID=2945102 RepID=A0A9X2IDV6_9ACTN|nr:[protein-PII] uridylyltransferase [Nocardioides bruguierae]MCL8026610.1 [protein-PII] uridylyltransferase [Nocardioides bruguierae]MCM0619657.1 [protein-PII] uridylyltransferase [Nocardioides bruguierae]